MKNRIISSNKFVEENSKHVKINYSKLEYYSRNLNCNKFKHWTYFSPFRIHIPDDFQSLLHFMFVFNSISFYYWGIPKWRVKTDKGYLDGTWALLYCLQKSLQKGFPLTNFSELLNLNYNEFQKIFQNEVEIPFLKERFKILKNISTIIVNKYSNNLLNLFEESNYNSKKLINNIVTNFEVFDDYGIYKRKKIYFYKKAQLFISDIDFYMDKYNMISLKNTDYLTACADYKLPQVLRFHDIIKYTQSLDEKINKRIILNRNSDEEIEIRANTIIAIEKIKEILIQRKECENIKSSYLNDYLWICSQNKNIYKNEYHLTPSIYY